MNTRRFRVAAILLTAALATACKGGGSQTDQRLKEVEQKLADTQKQLADEQARKEADAAAQAQAAQAQADAAAAAAAAAPGGAKGATGTTGSAKKAAAQGAASQKYVTAEQAAAARGEAQKVVEQQRNVNAAQADTNAHLQNQVDALKPRQLTIPAGTTIQVRTVSELSTDKLADGSTFDAVLEKDLKSGDAVIAKAGSRAHGVVVTSDKGGRVKGTASLILGLKSIVTVRGTTLAVQTDTTSSEAASTKKKDAVRTGIATGVGAAVGGIIGGGKGAAIGAGTGAAVGVGTNAATRGAAAKVEAESLLEFHLAAPVTVTYTPAPPQ